MALATFVISLAGTPVRAGQQPATALDATVGDIAGQIAQSVRGRELTMAVPDVVTLDGRVTVLGRYIAEELITALFTRRVQVVERSLLDRAFTELDLGTTDLMDPNAVQRFGRLVGAQAIIVGTLTELGHTIKLNARVVEVETGQVVGAASSQIVKDATVSEMLSRSVPVRRFEAPTRNQPESSLHDSAPPLPAGVAAE